MVPLSFDPADDDNIRIVNKLHAHGQEHGQVLNAMMAAQSASIARAAQAIAGCLLAGGKVLACGNGGSAAEAAHFAAEMVGRLERERPGLAALSLAADSALLTALGNDYGFDAVFSKQVAAFGAPGDVLLAISTSGASENVAQAVRAAVERELVVVALLGADGGLIAPMLRAGVDIAVNVPSTRPMRVQEMHKLIVHLLCACVDDQFLGDIEDA